MTGGLSRFFEFLCFLILLEWRDNGYYRIAATFRLFRRVRKIAKDDYYLRHV